MYTLAHLGRPDSIHPHRGCRTRRTRPGRTETVPTHGERYQSFSESDQLGSFFSCLFSDQLESFRDGGVIIIIRWMVSHWLHATEPTVHLPRGWHLFDSRKSLCSTWIGKSMPTQWLATDFANVTLLRGSHLVVTSWKPRSDWINGKVHNIPQPSATMSNLQLPIDSVKL